MDEIAEKALHLIDESFHRVIPTELERNLRHSCGLTRIQAKAAIRKLVEKGVLSYRWELGHAFIERSFHRPVRVSEHIVLSPAGFGFTADPGDTAIVMEKGSAFGTGRHPTTQLCLAAVDRLITELAPWPDLTETMVLDVGTGSGVLLLGAVSLGLSGGVGIDRDPCAVFEARKNAFLNNLSHRIQIEDRALEQIKGPFDLICANLRFPTLIGYSKSFHDRLKYPGAIVLSGLKNEEVPEVRAAYELLKMNFIAEDRKNGWSSLIFGNWSGAAGKDS